MYRLAGAIAAVALTACATADPNAIGATEERVTMSDGGAQVLDVNISRGDPAQATQLNASREAIWLLLPEVYEEVGLPEPAMDQSTWTVAVQDHVAMRRIGSERMSQLLECGRDMTGAHADTHRIRLNVRTWLTGNAPATEVHTRVEATATSVEGRAGTITCTTRGVLEQRIAEALRTRLADGQPRPTP
ncbi:MAG TPA: hypothetical protein VHG09_08885 [Longimicrobiales bacterium]|nr:hypothetical protein [Longimicrobiales bacterium]